MNIKRLVALGSIALIGLMALAGAAGAYNNDFESDTAGWGTSAASTITQQPDDYDNPGDYADLIDSAGGTNHARLGRGTCTAGSSAGGPFVNCPGPYTYWGDGNSYTWNGPYTTQVDIYLDTEYANLHPDTYGGNYAGLTTPNPSTDPADFGTRFDFTSAINSSTPDVNDDAVHLRDFGFNVSTGYVGDTCDGFMITGQTVVNRNNANPNIGGHDPQCIDESGWYTFKHSFSDEAGFLKVVMEITPVGFTGPTADWTITGIDSSGTFGCNRYGWFSNQEIFGLPMDNAKMEGGCAGPTITRGQILPTGTTCQAYDAGADDLDTVQYTLTKGDNPKINSVAPGVFFYYGTITGNEGDEFTITQSDDGSTPFIPVQHRQVILYDENCNVLKWNPDTDDNGVVTGTLPSTGTFIISVKYSAAALKGELDPGTVAYTIDDATVLLQKK